MKRKIILAAVAVGVLAAAAAPVPVLAVTDTPGAVPSYGGHFGPPPWVMKKIMQGGGKGGFGHHGGMFGKGGCMKGGKLDKPLTIEQVKAQFEQGVALRGNPNVKVGTVKKLNKDTALATIVTKNGSLVRTWKVDLNTGVRTAAD